MDAKTTVFVVDDNESVGLAVERLLNASGYATKRWKSAPDFLAEHDPQMAGCVVTDLIMPGMSGLELRQVLIAGEIPRQVILLTGSDTLVRIADEGAIVLRKPVNKEDLLQAIDAALTKDALVRSPRPQQ